MLYTLTRTTGGYVFHLYVELIQYLVNLKVERKTIKEWLDIGLLLGVLVKTTPHQLVLVFVANRTT